MFCVNSIGSKGGLVMLWKGEEKFEVINYSNHHIHLSVKQANLSEPWLITGSTATQKLARQMHPGHYCHALTREVKHHGVSFVT